MVDCGSQGSFLNSKLHFKNAPALIPKSSPLPLVLADGKRPRHGAVTHHAPILLRTAGHVEDIALDMFPVNHDIIMGMPWLQRHSPHISWGSSPVPSRLIPPSANTIVTTTNAR